MPAKRSHDDLDDIHESRQPQVHQDDPKPAKKPRREGPPKIRKQVHASSVNAVKKRIRDVTRLLSRSEDLPADVRLENERALAAYQQELNAADEEKTRQRMIKKYHMVRFFERQKATRTLKKLKKRLLEATTAEDVEDIKSQMHIAEVDLNYAHSYPLNERYISLYPPKGAEEGVDQQNDAVKPPMWAEIERRMEEGTLKELRYGVREGHVEKPKTNRQKPATTKPRLASETQNFKKRAEPGERVGQKERVPEPQDYTLNRRERRKAMIKTGALITSKAAKKPAIHEPIANEVDNDDNGSDGGFFE
ncbi:hypothetical protein V502_07183 [Pseudogymnoascus sp. VKM F-4520 (FW-2644)]|nr:hypothetical protein V502_07183 [Pseudogymnoascus sp. VKM F-4520 (FW-2644)]